ncbi:NUDIX hydrolase [Kytococcus schroeteri]|uniref:NUDIX hydrolase n=1 Tax=Kytococcus schroeteri TaxID=138300 RepID=UPI0035E76E23
MTTPHRDFPMPPALVPAVRAWLDTPEADRPAPVAPRAAATVMVVRDGAQGVEVFMQTRAASMAFAPGMMVFPGGGVDPRDEVTDAAWSGPTPQEWSARMPGTTPASAQQLVLAAAREVFEETGVLLAAHPDGRPVSEAEASAPAAVEGRRRVEAREVAFSDLLTELGLTVRTECLSVRDHWTTPECEPRRYDTWFFAARIPEGQEPDDGTSEAVSASWERPAAVLERAAGDAGLMLPPTIAALEDLRAAGSAAEVLAGRHEVPEVMPWPEEVPVGPDAPDGLVMRTPWRR